METLKNKDNKNWFAFYTKSRAEKQIHIRLTERGFEAFLPLITHLRQWSDRKKKVKEPLIRSYVFVYLEEEKITEVLQTPGCVGILKYLEKPAIVREEEIESLRILVNGTADQIEFHDAGKLASGDRVEVIRGPFQGLIGEYVRMKGKYRIIVKIESLGNVISVDIPGSNIKVRS